MFLPLVSFATNIYPVPVQQSVHTLSGIYSVSVDDGSGGSLTSVDVNKHWVDYPVNNVPTQHTNAYYANVNAVVGKYHFNAFRPTSELVGDLQRLGELLQKGQLPL